MGKHNSNIIRIEGGIPLCGAVEISGSKNSTLPLLAASMMIQEPTYITNIPNITDVNLMLDLIQGTGSTIIQTQNKAVINSKTINTHIINQSAKQIRASILLASPMLHLMNKVEIPLPGGCKIGKRPIDIHLNALSKMGANVQLSNSKVNITCKGRLQGTTIDFTRKSVGATQQIILAATLAEGITVIHHAAQEPEVLQLVSFLSECGAEISGAGTNTITITGVESLTAADCQIQPDRIEAGTYAIAIAATRGNAELINVRMDHFPELSDILQQIGVIVVNTEKGVKIKANSTAILPSNLSTGPYPAFPTDLQAPITSLFCTADTTNSCMITENLFENRFGHVPELIKMKANITTEGNTITVSPVKKLIGNIVSGQDLRSSKAMVIAGLVAKGVTEIHGTHYLRRGYQGLTNKLLHLGAAVEEVA